MICTHVDRQLSVCRVGSISVNEVRVTDFETGQQICARKVQGVVELGLSRGNVNVRDAIVHVAIVIERVFQRGIDVGLQHPVVRVGMSKAAEVGCLFVAIVIESSEFGGTRSRNVATIWVERRHEIVHNRPRVLVGRSQESHGVPGRRSARENEQACSKPEYGQGPNQG